MHSSTGKQWKQPRFALIAGLGVCASLTLAMAFSPTQAEDAATKSSGISDSEAWRSSPPKLPPPRPFNLPSIKTYQLDNGVNVKFVEDHRFPFVTVYLGFKSGSVLEAKDKLGLADLTADMLVEGTEKRTSKQIAEEVDFIGGALNAVSDYDITLVSGSALSKYTDRLLDLVSDVTLHPSFPEDEATLKKTNLIQELVIKRSRPSFLLEERFNKAVFGNHPYAIVSPTEQTINSITRKDLSDFHKKTYLPNDTVIVVVGDFDSDKMKEQLATEFGSKAWAKGEPSKANFAAAPAQHGRKIYLVDRPGSVQSSIKIGNVGIKRLDPDYFAVQVANQILGGSANSRLFLNIREKKGYTYGAYSHIAARREEGPFAAGAEVRTEVTAPSIKEFLFELDRIRKDLVTDEEISDAKSYMVGSFQLGLETQSGLAQRILEASLYDLPSDYLETYSNKVMDVSREDAKRAATRLINSDNLVIAVVGDGAKIMKELEQYGPIDVYDTSGKLTLQKTETPKSSLESTPKSPQ